MKEPPWMLWVMLAASALVPGSSAAPPKLLGLRIQTNGTDGGHETPIVGYSLDGVVQVEPKEMMTLVFFGTGLSAIRRVILKSSDNASCEEAANNSTDLSRVLVVEHATFKYKSDPDHEIRFKAKFPSVMNVYVCLSYTVGDDPTIYFEDDMSHNVMNQIQVRARVRQYVLGFAWLQIMVLFFLLILSGLFSGLNLGLMSLDPTELDLIIKSGDKTEQKYAQTIMPVRKTGNYLLCSLLFGNVVVNAAISILFDDLTSGLVALVASSLGIVMFGEIVPQSVCNRKGLAVGHYTIYITRFFMIATAPLSWPVGKILDCILGEEAGRVYDKGRLKELIRMSAQQQGPDGHFANEFQIVTGALDLDKKTVADIMTSIDDAFMLPSDATLNVKMIADVIQNGFTRIPVFEGDDRNNVVALLNVKDLALLDPDDNLTVQTVCGYWHHPLRFVMEDTPLSLMLEEFKKGHYHLALVQRIEEFEDKDPCYTLTGVVTLEDVIEEILQAEIMDETDAITDNVERKRRKDVHQHRMQVDLTNILQGESSSVGSVSVQLQLAAIQWLSSNLPPFSSDIIAPVVLQRLVRRNVHLERPSQCLSETLGGLVSKGGPGKELYRQAQVSDVFVLILEGRVEVTIGAAAMAFEAGPFHIFGREVLDKMTALAPKGTITGASFIPDFNATIRSDCTYLEVSALNYWNAYKASLLEMGRPPPASMLNSPVEEEASMRGKVASNPAAMHSPASARLGPRAFHRSRPSVDLGASGPRGSLGGLAKAPPLSERVPRVLDTPAHLSIENLSLRRGDEDANRATIGSPKDASRWLAGLPLPGIRAKDDEDGEESPRSRSQLIVRVLDADDATEADRL